MNIDMLKPGDFLTWTDDDEHDICVGRVIKLVRSDYGVIGADMLMFPSWRDVHGSSNMPYISEFYLNEATRSTELEILAWMDSAQKYEDGMKKTLDTVHKTFSRPVNKKRVTPYKSLAKYESPRLPPKPNCIVNWLWSKLISMKIYNPKTGRISS